MRKLIYAMILIVLAQGLLGCDTPGTYMGPADVNRSVLVGRMKITPAIVPIGPRLFDSYTPRPHEYRVGPQDILTIIVWNHPELTIPSMQTTSESVNFYTHANETTNNPPGVLVDERGEIFFPLAGKFRVEDMTVDQIRVALTHRLYRYIRNPQVSVRVTVFRNKPIYVMGEVVKPGIQPITDMPMSIMDAINLAGGIDKESSDAHYIYVLRGDYFHPTVYWLDATTPGALLLSRSFLLEPRDVVMVSTAGVARYSRVVNKILPTIQTFMYPYFKTPD